MVSVCLAAFNGEKYIEEQVESILMQLGLDDELIISDDGSQDHSLETISSFCDKRIVLLHNQGKHGLVGNFENALNHANGDFIFLADQDDIWKPQKVEVIKKQLRQYDLVVHDAEMIDGEGHPLGKTYYSTMHHKKDFISNLWRTRWLGCCMAFKREVLEMCLPFPSNIVAHDYWIGMLGKLKFRYCFINDILICYRRHGNNASPSGEKSGNSMFYKIVTKRMNMLVALANRYLCNRFRLHNKKMNKKTLLFIGGAGFIGSNIIRRLQHEDYEIHVCEPVGANMQRLNGLQAQVHHAALSDIESVSKIIQDYEIDIVVHLVSTLIPGSTYEDYKNEYKNVIFPSIELMELCAQQKIRFVFFSSGGTVYGNRTDVQPFKETDAMNPISYYGWSKQMMENSIQFMNRTVGLDYLILRPSNAFGPGQNLNGKQGLVAVAIGKLLRNEEIEVWGDASAVRDYIYVDDLANIFVKLIEADVHHTTLNVGSGLGYSVNDVLASLKIVSGKVLKIVYQNPRPVDVSYMVLDTTRLKETINYELTPFMDGVRKFYEESVRLKW